jgi:hypothetical protein
MKWHWPNLDSPAGHLFVVLVIFFTGIVLLVVFKQDYGKEVTAGALGSLWTLLRQQKPDGASSLKTTLVSGDQTTSATTARTE